MARLRMLSGIASCCNQQLTLNDTLVKVEFEKSCRRVSLCREGFDDCSPKNKMIMPPVVPWIEETHELPSLRINRTNITSLPGIAA